ncbi:SUMF1/EgtB/PvdO family nonheme iron enzyme [Sorangium sp. So ce854]|uniref:SUMF1/EgtB/PvdO family nonheme iron enzyme n=1 Tax=Sorangium sp. So ce854 TaxID=3133322 RepID=UPI003F627ACD
MPTPSPRLRVALAALAAAPLACSRGDADRGRDAGAAPPAASAPAPPAASAPAPPAAAADAAAAAASGPAGAPPAAGADAGAPPAPEDPMATHHEAREDLLRLFSLKDFTERERKLRSPELFLEKNFGGGTPARIHQGNKELARHTRSKAQCLEGLRGVVLQTEEQRARCGGRENMVPVFRTARGKPKPAEFCIDIFEFPNRPCELPMVWASPTQAATVCSLQGKRLCTEDEWSLACSGDPEGGAPRTYAYGDELDLTVCHTQTPHREIDGKRCDGDTARSAYQTCATDTEPAGSYPACRSRFGVFDQHGNVAEIMTRRDRDDGKLYSQLKGSAWFYVAVAREHDAPRPKGRETYPDHCAFSPRWHVEPMENAWHANYHLGFRCCATIR